MLLFGLIELPLWSFLLPVAAYLLYSYGVSGFDLWEKQGVPGPKPVPFLGTAIRMFKTRSFAKVDRECGPKYGSQWGEFLGKTPVLVCSDPEFIRQTMIKEFQSMPNRRFSELGPTLNHFLTVLRDDHWKHVRHSLSPAFTTGKLKQMKPLIKNCVIRFLGSIRKYQDENIPVKKLCSAFTIEVICSTAFGIEVDSLTNPDSEIIANAGKLLRQPSKSRSFTAKMNDALLGIMMFIVPRNVKKLLLKLGWSGPLDSEAMDYFRMLLEQIIATEADEQREGQGRNFLQMCLENLAEADSSDPETKTDVHGSFWTTKGLTKDDIIANAILFFMAGNETTASSLQYVIFELAHHPEIQQRLYEDIKTYCTSENATYDELAKLTYLDWTIDETLRFYPPAARFDRCVSKSVTINGITIPPGALVSASATLLHFNPDIWPYPYTFDPERFSPEVKGKRHPCAWVPFGVGNRNCIGMRLALLEMKAALVAVLWNFKIETSAETLARPITEFYPNFQNHPMTPILLKMVPRN